MKFVIISNQEWENIYVRTKSQNLLQSSDYLAALQQAQGIKFELYSIQHKGNVIGIFSIVKDHALKGLINTFILDRGPLWINGRGTQGDVELFFNRFNQFFPAGILSRRRIIPELKYNQENKEILDKSGLKLKMLKSYSSIVVDLDKNIDELRAALRSNWRNQLLKAEKYSIDCQWYLHGEYLGWLLSKYLKDKTEKAYRGPSSNFMRLLSNNFAKSGNLVIGLARNKGHILAANLVLCHGNSATYQIGWVGLDGRKICANNLLLWRTMLFLKERKVQQFDLGGLNSLDAQGVSWYKSGMGGQKYELVGTYA